MARAFRQKNPTRQTAFVGLETYRNRVETSFAPKRDRTEIELKLSMPNFSIIVNDDVTAGNRHVASGTVPNFNYSHV